MRKYVGMAVYWNILQVHLVPDHLPILFWKRTKVLSRFMLSSRVFHKRLPLKDIESRSKLIVLPDECFLSLHSHISGGFNPFRDLKISIMIFCKLLTCMLLFPFRVSNASNYDSYSLYKIWRARL